MRANHRLTSRILLASATAICWAASLSAQATTSSTSPSNQTYGDIVVTATRQERVISKVPISITAFSKAQMDAQGVRSIADIARLTPGVTFNVSSGFTGSQTNISIRGIQSTVGAATTGIYIDDTPIQIRSVGNSATNTYPLVFDLDRVEVLRGPQGTLFGAGAEGGTVRFVTPGPNYTRVEGYGRTELSFTQSGDPSYEAGLAVNIPLVEDRLALRASAWYRRDGGYIDRVDYSTQRPVDNNSNWSNSDAFKVDLGWKATDDITITPSVYYQRTYNNDSGAYWLNLSNPSEEKFRTGYVLQQPVRDRFLLPSLKVAVDLGSVQLISNSSYFDRKFTGNYDYTNAEAVQWAGSPYPSIPGQNAPTLMLNNQRNFSQEVRLQSSDPDSRFNWVIGGFYSRDRQIATQVVNDAYLDQLIADAIPGQNVESLFGSPLLNGSITFESRTLTHDEQLAGFGQADFRVTRKLKLTAGVRVARTKFNFVQDANGPIAGGPTTVSGGQSETPVTPKFGIDYQANPNLMFYASATKGYRVGGTQLPPRSLCGPDLAVLGFQNVSPTYNSDSVWTYEGGVKGKTPGGVFRFEADGYHTDWKNIQQSVYLPSCGSTFIGNLGSATINGFEAAFQLVPAAHLQLGLSLGYVNAKFAKTLAVGSTFLARKGDDLPVTPWTVTLSSNYEFTLLDHNAYMRADYQYLSGQPSMDPLIFGYDPTIPPRRASSLLALRTGAKISSWDVSVFVNNLLDDHPSLNRTRDTTFSPLYYDITYRPRTVGLTALTRF
jgi:iron complex outermembrane receptor protein